MSKILSKCKKAGTKLIKGKQSKKDALKIHICHKKVRKRREHEATQYFVCKQTNPFSCGALHLAEFSFKHK